MAQILKADALHAQLAARIREDIAQGTYAPGSTLPAEKDLGQAYGVSVTTVRRALIALRTEGLVQSHMGKRATIRANAGPPQTVERAAKYRLHLIAQADTEPRRGTTEADAATAATLKVEPKHPVFAQDTVCTEEGTGRTVLVRTVLPYAVAKEAELGVDPWGDAKDLTTALGQAFGKLTTSEYVRALMPTPEQSATLGQPDIAPVIETITVTAAKGRPLYAVIERRSAEGTALHYPL